MKDNKGIRIRNRKRANNLRKANSIKEEQKGLCRFIDCKWQVIEKVNGKYKHVGEHKDRGLQIENKMYLADGKYKLVNNKGFKIKKTYDCIPEWANDLLKEKYEDYKNIHS